MIEVVGETKFKEEHLKIAARMFFEKLQLAYDYKPSVNVNGSVTLFKAVDGFSILDDDYGLSKVCSIYAQIRIEEIN